MELVPGSEKAFEAALTSEQSKLQGETLWYRMIAGGSSPRYVRLRPRANLSELLADPGALPENLIAKSTIEILSLKPAMCYRP